jgi:hypothetical protein
MYHVAKQQPTFEPADWSAIHPRRQGSETVKIESTTQGQCQLCLKPKDGEVVNVNGIEGLKPMQLCEAHVMKMANLQADAEESSAFAKAGS